MVVVIVITVLVVLAVAASDDTTEYGVCVCGIYTSTNITYLRLSSSRYGVGVIVTTALYLTVTEYG